MHYTNLISVYRSEGFSSYQSNACVKRLVFPIIGWFSISDIRIWLSYFRRTDRASDLIFSLDRREEYLHTYPLAMLCSTSLKLVFFKYQVLAHAQCSYPVYKYLAVYLKAEKKNTKRVILKCIFSEISEDLNNRKWWRSRRVFRATGVTLMSLIFRIQTVKTMLKLGWGDEQTEACEFSGIFPLWQWFGGRFWWIQW